MEEWTDPVKDSDTDVSAGLPPSRGRVHGSYGHYPGAWPQIVNASTEDRWIKEKRHIKTKKCMANPIKIVK